MSGTTIISKFPTERNDFETVFCVAFNIPTNDNRILVKTTKQFFLRNILVPSGSIGKVVDLVCDGQLFLIDFGLPIVGRIPPGSELIQPVNLAQEVANLQADVNRFEAGLTELEQNLAGLADKWGVSDER
jgi:hypothetical protein